MAPIILSVPGFWEGPLVFEPVNQLLKKQGFETRTVPLLSTGTISPGNPSMIDDINAIRQAVSEEIENNKLVVLFLHSAGGFLGSNAIEGLTVKARKEKGLEGGVGKIIFLSGAVFPKGFEHGPLPFATIDGGAMYCTDLQNLFFNDLSPAAAAAPWISKCEPQPSRGWDDTVTYCGWQDCPSVYIITEKDACLPESLQQQLASMAGSHPIEKVPGGHLALVSVPDQVATLVAMHSEIF